MRSQPVSCPQCGATVSQFAAGCASCGADLERRRATARPGMPLTTQLDASTWVGKDLGRTMALVAILMLVLVVFGLVLLLS